MVVTIMIRPVFCAAFLDTHSEISTAVYNGLDE